MNPCAIALSTRRRFLKASAVAAAAPLIVPSRVIGANGPGGKIAVGMIGMGR